MIGDAMLRFRMLGLEYQTVLIGAFFFTIYDLSLYFGQELTAIAAASEALTASAVFAATYYITSRIIQMRRMKRRGKGQRHQ